MQKSARRRLIALLLGLILALLLGEALLSIFDPLGFAYYRDQAALGALLIPDARGYNFRSGTHQLTEFTFTILPDGTRAVPDTHRAAPTTLVFVGDSVTFGYGVNDDQTWVNLIARDLPNVRVINAGVSGYNSTNVRRAITQYPQAEALVYLIINNDAEREYQPDFAHPPAPEPSSWLALYLLKLPEYLHPVGTKELIARGQIDRYLQDIRTIAADRRVLLVSFDDELAALTIRAGFTVARIERGTDRVSPADGHPGVRGSQAIARQIVPLVRARFGL